MDVQIIGFTETMVAAVEHFRSPALEHETARKLIAWKLQRRLLHPIKHRNYGIHHTGPRRTPPCEHHVDCCPSVERDVGPNGSGVVSKTIPCNRCAPARDIGPCHHNKAVIYLYED